jgi:hypothetical protein
LGIAIGVPAGIIVASTSRVIVTFLCIVTP